MIDYYKEFINILSHNSITHLPSPEIIASSQEVALLIWQNYSPGYYSEYEDEPIIKWGEILPSYKNDQTFWEKAFEKSGRNHNMLLDEQFQKDFPTITNYWLSNDDKLMYAFQKTDNYKFNELMQNPERKDLIYKEFLYLRPNRIKDEDIKKYSEDKKFLEHALISYPSHYKGLTPEDKLNHDFVKLALKDKKMFFEIPQEYQKHPTIREYWLKLHIHNIGSQDFQALSEKEQLMIVGSKPEMIASLYAHHGKKYHHLITEIIIQHPTYIKFIPNEEINSTLIKNLVHKPEYLEYLHSFVSNYQRDDLKSKDDMRTFAILEKYKLYPKDLKDNLFYQLRKLKIAKVKLPLSAYKGFIDTIINHETYSSEQSRLLINILKSVTEIEVLQTLPRTKDLLAFYRHEQLKNTISSEDKVIKNKPKI